MPAAKNPSPEEIIDNRHKPFLKCLQMTWSDLEVYPQDLKILWSIRIWASPGRILLHIFNCVFLHRGSLGLKQWWICLAVFKNDIINMSQSVYHCIFLCSQIMPSLVDQYTIVVNLESMRRPLQWSGYVNNIIASKRLLVISNKVIMLMWQYVCLS